MKFITRGIAAGSSIVNFILRGLSLPADGALATIGVLKAEQTRGRFTKRSTIGVLKKEQTTGRFVS